MVIIYRWQLFIDGYLDTSGSKVTEGQAAQPEDAKNSAATATPQGRCMGCACASNGKLREKKMRL